MKFKIIDIEQRTPEWYEFKQDKVSGSMASAIMGMNPWTTPLELYLQVQADAKKPMTAAMQEGIDREDEVRQWVNENCKTGYAPAVIQSVKYPQLMASLDGLFWHKKTPCALEIKVRSSPEPHEIVKSGLIPEYDIYQLQMIMLLLDIYAMDYVSCYKQDKELVIAARDDELCKIMLPKLLEFHERLINYDPPPATERDYVEWKDYSYVGRAWKYAKAIQDLRELEEKTQQLRKELTENAPHPRVKVGPLKMVKYSSKGAVNYKWLVEKEKIDLEKYRKEPLIKWKIDVDED